MQALRGALPPDARRAPPRPKVAELQGLANDLASAARTPIVELATGDAAATERRNPRAAEPPPPPTLNQDVEIPLELDSDDLEIAPTKAAKANAPAAAMAPVASAPAGLDPTIFRAYDIRGIVDRNLGEDTVYQIGRALGAEAAAVSCKRLIVGGDGRLSSPSLREAVIGGLRDSGIDVVDIGEVPTPLLYYATHLFRTGSGVMITGSHNPPDYNGLKMVIAGGTLAGDDILALRTRIDAGDLRQGAGEYRRADVGPAYLERITVSARGRRCTT